MEKNKKVERFTVCQYYKSGKYFAYNRDTAFNILDVIDLSSDLSTIIKFRSINHLKFNSHYETNKILEAFISYNISDMDWPPF